MSLDLIVVGGSYAGMAAALQVARARRSVLVVDAGVRRNRFAQTAHGFLGQDGRSPVTIAAEARDQLVAYPNLQWLDETATRAARTEHGFWVELSDGTTREAKRLVLATGIIDVLPEIPGLKQRWGRSVLHCPYCHGYEVSDGRLGVLATGPWSIHQALLIPEWGRTTLFTNGVFEPDAEQMARLAERGVAVETADVLEITGAGADVRLGNGRTIELDGLFTAPPMRLASPLAEQLGCEFEESPLGSFIRTDATQETTISGLFAAGDTARATGTISLAVGDGAMAGAAVHRSLIFP